MIRLIKENIEEFRILPNPVKWGLAVIFTVLLFVAGFNILESVKANRKIEELQKMNQQLEKVAVAAQGKAKQAEFNAAAENLRSQNLELQLNELQKVKTSQDNEIQKTTAKITVNRNNLNRHRVSAPKPISTDELERRLEDRYSQTKSN